MIVVIPCFNEANRIRRAEVSRLLQDPRIEIMFVDDGSTDDTAIVLQEICDAGPDRRAQLVTLDDNVGKAEAVRIGLNRSLERSLERALEHSPERGADIVGYLDADFATPASELVRLLDELERTDADVVLGSRVARLGANIDRKPQRHYIGRVFATAASIVLDLPVYDTQCGAKLFRATPALRHALSVPFRSRWSFDVELIGRLLAGGPGTAPILRAAMLEVPLEEWIDIAGSKLDLKSSFAAGIDVLALGARVKRLGPRGFFPD